MKNNWVRLIAGALASVVLVGAIALTGGMKKGSRTDGLLYQASGIHPDAELLLIDRQTVTAEEYLYWLAYDCEYLSTYVPDVDWSAELTEGLSYGDYAKTDTLETVKLYSVVRAWAEEAGVTLTEEDQAALDAQRLEYVTYYGSEEAYQQQLPVSRHGGTGPVRGGQRLSHRQGHLCGGRRRRRGGGQRLPQAHAGGGGQDRRACRHLSGAPGGSDGQHHLCRR